MAFKTFNRTVYAALETNEGITSIPTDGEGDYIETSDPTFSVTNRMFERNPTRISITPVPQIVPGTAVSAPSATVEFTFSVELAGSGSVATAPRWSRLLQACGMEEIKLDSVSVDTFAGGSTNQGNCLLNNERISAGASDTAFDNTVGSIPGRVVGDTFEGDTTVYYYQGSGAGGGTPLAAISNDQVICGEVSNGAGRFTASTGSSANSGFAWAPKSTTVLGGATGTSSSLTIRMCYAKDGAYVEGVGCRGNVEFAMTSGDRVLMNFTFTGRLSNYTDSGAANDAPTITGIVPPPAFVGTSLMLQDTSYAVNAATSAPDFSTSSVFTTFSINLGNEVTVRESVAATPGYDVAYITGRSPSATFNPDAVTEATFQFWKQFLSGAVTRAKMIVGTTAGNKFEFRMPAMQFTGIGDGNRDEVYVYDATTTLTGGDYGSSIEEGATTAAATSTQLNPRLGTNNEFILYYI